jgi:hypothetical protein
MKRRSDWPERYRGPGGMHRYWEDQADEQRAYERQRARLAAALDESRRQHAWVERRVEAGTLPPMWEWHEYRREWGEADGNQ